MSDERVSDLVGTTDSLEAASVFKAMKNMFFAISVFCLCILEVCFWMVDTQSLIDPNSFPQPTSQPRLRTIAPVDAQTGAIMLAATAAGQDQSLLAQAPSDANAASKVSSPNTPAASATSPAQKPAYQVLHLKFIHIKWLIKFFNFILIYSVALYFLTIVFALKVSLVGRLGGINHITRALFLALLAFVFILPWQNYFGSVVAGWTFTPEQLLLDKADVNSTGNIWDIGIYYVRYTGWWVLIILILFFSLLRTNRWSKATMRRLGVM